MKAEAENIFPCYFKLFYLFFSKKVVSNGLKIQNLISNLEKIAKSDEVKRKKCGKKFLICDKYKLVTKPAAFRA